MGSASHGQQGAGFGFVVAAAVLAALREFVAATIRPQQEGTEADMAGVRAGAAIAPSLPEMLFVHAHMVASKAVFVLIKRNQSESNRGQTTVYLTPQSRT